MQALKLTCPACQYRFDLLSGLQDAEQRAYWLMICNSNLSSDQISLLFRYLTMFKPTKNAMSFKALNARTRELVELLKSGRVSRNGNVRAATPALWWEAIEQLVANKPESLDLPMKSHAYLTQVVFNRAEAAVAKMEAADIEEKRNRFRDDDESREGLTSLTSMFKNLPKGDTSAS